MKKVYIKPTVQVMMLNYRMPLLTISRVESVGMEDELDKLLISDELAGEDFFAR